MKTKKSIPNKDTCIIAEYRLLNAIAKKKEVFNHPQVTEDCFIHDVAKSIYQAITQLYETDVDITPASLYQAGSNIDCDISRDIVDKIFEVDTDGADRIEDILVTLQDTKNKNRVLWELERLRASLEESNSINVDETLSKLYKIDDLVTKSGKSNSTLLDFHDWSDRYISDLEQRKLGRKYSYGDPLLDKYIYKGAAPGCITIIAASTNMGKSTYVLSLMDNLLENNVPCMYISLEMGTIDTMDRLVAKRLGIPSTELYKSENIEGIIEQVKEEQQNLSNRKNFFFCEATGVDVDKLRSLVREFKQKTKQDYCLVAIDLLSGMKNFMVSNNTSISTASNIEVNMNKLEELAKEENIHIMGVVQINRQSDNLKISHVEEIDRLRPTLGDFKNSGSYAEKATSCLVLFRPKFYSDRYCKNDPAAETMEDILEVQILKDRNAQAGRVMKYMFDGKYFKLVPLVEEDEQKLEKLDKLKELNIDY